MKTQVSEQETANQSVKSIYETSSERSKGTLPDKAEEVTNEADIQDKKEVSKVDSTEEMNFVGSEGEKLEKPKSEIEKKLEEEKRETTNDSSAGKDIKVKLEDNEFIDDLSNKERNLIMKNQIPQDSKFVSKILPKEQTEESKIIPTEENKIVATKEKEEGKISVDEDQDLKSCDGAELDAKKEKSTSEETNTAIKLTHKKLKQISTDN